MKRSQVNKGNLHYWSQPIVFVEINSYPFIDIVQLVFCDWDCPNFTYLSRNPYEKYVSL